MLEYEKQLRRIWLAICHYESGSPSINLTVADYWRSGHLQPQFDRRVPPNACRPPPFERALFDEQGLWPPMPSAKGILTREKLLARAALYEAMAAKVSDPVTSRGYN